MDAVKQRIIYIDEMIQRYREMKNEIFRSNGTISAIQEAHIKHVIATFKNLRNEIVEYELQNLQRQLDLLLVEHISSTPIARL